VDIGNWALETADGERETIPEGTTLSSFAYYVYSPPYQWRDNSEEAKEFVNVSCLGEEVKLDVDNRKQYDPYYRILAVVYVNDTNLNEKLLREGYAEIMHIPPSEFNPYEWKADYTPSLSPTLSPTTTLMPGFDFLFAIIGVVAAIYLVKRGR